MCPGHRCLEAAGRLDSVYAAAMSFARVESLQHEIQAHYQALRAIRTRKALERSALWAEIGGEVRRVLEGVERGDWAPVPPPAAVPAQGGRVLRAVAWNIQRGARLDDLRRAVLAPPFAGTDLLLLSEVDVGLGRSGNRNVARELAEALGMSYAFGVSYLALTDDFGDDAGGLENTLALSGAAVLSRYPIGRVENIDLPELRDKFHSSEKRLGKKRALLAEIALPDGPLAVAACHLDSNASPAQRARQLGGDPRQRRSQRRGARAGGRRFQHQHLRPLEHAGAGARPLAQAAGHRVPRHHRSVHDAGEALRAAGVRAPAGARLRRRGVQRSRHRHLLLRPHGSLRPRPRRGSWSAARSRASSCASSAPGTAACPRASTGSPAATSRRWPRPWSARAPPPTDAPSPITRPSSSTSRSRSLRRRRDATVAGP